MSGDSLCRPDRKSSVRGTPPTRASTRSGEESPVARGVEAATLRSSIYATASGSALVRFASKPARRYKARLLSPPARDSRTRSAGSLANRRAISYIAAAALNVTIAPKSAGFAHKFDRAARPLGLPTIGDPPHDCGSSEGGRSSRRPTTRLRKQPASVPLHGVRRVFRLHGVRRVFRLHGVSRVLPLHGVRRVFRLHRVSRVFRLHGVRRVFRLHGVRRVLNLRRVLRVSLHVVLGVALASDRRPVAPTLAASAGRIVPPG